MEAIIMYSDAKICEYMDRLAIREQVDAYMDHLNHRDWDAIGETMTEDLIWSVSGADNFRIETRAAMLEMLRTVQQYQLGWVFQMGHGLVIHDLTETEARARHTLHIMSDQFMYIGIYYDRLRKESDGVWRFCRRDYRMTYAEKPGSEGKTYRSFPEPGYENLPSD